MYFLFPFSSPAPMPFSTYSIISQLTPTEQPDVGSRLDNIDVGCSPGTVEKDSSCVPCPSGTFYYNPTNSTGTCAPCPIGFYTSMVAQIACQACPKGHGTSTEGSSSPSDCILLRPVCADGHQPNLRKVCVPCPRGTYRQGLQLDCQYCPAGYTTEKQGSLDPSACSLPLCGDRPCHQMVQNKKIPELEKPSLMSLSTKSDAPHANTTLIDLTEVVNRWALDL